MRFTNNLICISILSFTFFCCKSERKVLPLNLNISIRDSLIKKYGENIAILSCLRCDCFVQYYNELNDKIDGYVLLTDTTCNKLKNPVNHISNPDLEKLSDDLYNLTLIKYRDGKITTKILDADDNKQIGKIIKSFFQ